MTPGPFLLTSGAFILVVVSAYDFYCDSALLEGYRRRKLQAYVDTSPGSTFAKRLARHGLGADSDLGEPVEAVRADAADVIDEIEAFHAWLIAGCGHPSLTAPAPSSISTPETDASIY